MKVAIIYSNHQSGNFNELLLGRLKEQLLKDGHEFVIRDLYALDFNPVLRISDFEKNSAGQPAEDIAKEQSFVRWADILLFIYPVWWGGMPAIVKGYIDRVFSWGFAYRSNGKGVYPLLTDKKAIVMSTMGQARADYEKGMFKAMNLVNVEGIFGFCGIQLAEELYFTSIHSTTPEEREKYFAQGINAIKKMPAYSNG